MKKILLIIILIITYASSYAQVKLSNQIVDRAIHGDAVAQLNLGKCYEEGNGVEKNDSLATVWYKKSADQSNLEAMYRLGRLYCYGIELDSYRTYIDCAEGLLYLRTAAKNGYSKASETIKDLTSQSGCVYIPEIYYENYMDLYTDVGELPSQSLLEDHLSQLMQSQDNIQALVYLAIYNLQYSDKKDAVNWLMKGFKKLYDGKGKFREDFNYVDTTLTVGDKDLPFFYVSILIPDFLGLCYENGIGVEKDLEKAAFYYGAADAHRFDYGMSTTYGEIREALCYEKLSNYDKYFEILKSMDNHPYALLFAGDTYMKGPNKVIDYKKAKECFEKIISEEYWGGLTYESFPEVYADACYRLYEIYRDGLGVNKDERFAELYFKESVKRGCKTALHVDQEAYENINKIK